MQRLGALALAAVVLAMASLVQGGGWNQNAHLALVRSLSHGTPIVDDTWEGTGDLAEHDGHLYSAKAPGVALLAVGPYFVLDRTGVLEGIADLTNTPRADVDLWFIAALVCALLAGVALVLVGRLGDLVAPGYGIAAAATLGLGTLLLPFATLVFAHVPAGALAFSAFAILWLRRGAVATVAAGVLAGLAVTVEYSLGIAVVALGLYAVCRGDLVRRGGAFAAGALAGVIPLFAYNWWAFDSPLHFPYEDARPIFGTNANDRGLFGISWPSPEVAVRLLFDERGLIVVTPVVLVAVAALVPMARRGFRAEAYVVGGLAFAFLVYNAGYDVPFGGDSPGPRFLVALLPFLAVPLAVAFERWTMLTIALAVVSAVYAVGVTATGPLQASGWEWIDDLPGTATTLELVRFVPLVVVGAALAVIATLRRSRASQGTPAAP